MFYLIYLFLGCFNLVKSSICKLLKSIEMTKQKSEINVTFFAQCVIDHIRILSIGLELACNGG